MTDLERRALAQMPLTQATVLSFYDGSRSGTAEQCLRALCESHERLRMELQGTEQLLEDADRRHKEELDHWRAEVKAVLALLGDFPDTDCPAVVISACRDRLRKLTTKGE